MTSIESPDSHVFTRCVEAGVDFSFRSAFRESWALVNLLQIAGRARRLGIADLRSQISEFITEAQMWSSRLNEPRLPVKRIGPDGEWWAWIEGNYDSFLGYMAGVLQRLQAGEKGFEPL